MVEMDKLFPQYGFAWDNQRLKLSKLMVFFQFIEKHMNLNPCKSSFQSTGNHPF